MPSPEISVDKSRHESRYRSTALWGPPLSFAQQLSLPTEGGLQNAARK